MKDTTKGETVTETMTADAMQKRIDAAMQGDADMYGTLTCDTCGDSYEGLLMEHRPAAWGTASTCKPCQDVELREKTYKAEMRRQAVERMQSGGNLPLATSSRCRDCGGPASDGSGRCGEC